MRKHVTEFLFWRWNVDFSKLQKKGRGTENLPWPSTSLLKKLQDYPSVLDVLNLKLPQGSISLLEAFVYDFPHYGIYSYEHYSYYASQYSFEESPESWIEACLNFIYIFFRYLPIVFNDLYFYYTSNKFSFNLKLEENEFIFIDFWIKALPVIEELLGELLIRDKPFITALPLNNNFGFSVSEAFFLCPPVSTENFNFIAFKQELWNFFQQQPNFISLIKLYLAARVETFKICETSLISQGIIVEEIKIVEYFLTEYIFRVKDKKISEIVLRLLKANLFLKSPDLKQFYEVEDRLIWETKSEEARKYYYSSLQKSVKDNLNEYLKSKNNVVPSSTKKE